MIFKNHHIGFLNSAFFILCLIFLMQFFETKNAFSEEKKQNDVIEYHLQQANSGNVESQFWLGVTYAKGLEGEKNNIKAYMWLDIAAENGKIDAAHVLDIVAKRMSSFQIDEAKKLADKWREGKE